MIFKGLNLFQWRQFESVEIDFHPRLTIITGTNGSGKTTILSILGQLLGVQTHYLSVPIRINGQLTLALDSTYDLYDRRVSTPQSASGGIEIGSLVFANGRVAQMVVSGNIEREYRFYLHGSEYVYGMYIPSHRPAYTYERVDEIPSRPIFKEEAYTRYRSSTMTRFLGGFEGDKPMAEIKKTLISLALFATQSRFMGGDQQAIAIWDGFEEILRKLLPDSLGFEKIVVEAPEVLFQTRTGLFPIDSISGGISSILDIAWNLYMFNAKGDEFICLIDEPENHLHPAMQQSFLHNFLDAFPNVQFIIATHSPFMISAVRESYVYVLNYKSDGKVYSERLDVINKAGTANEILREVLGLPFTMPLWAEEKIEEIVSQHIEEGITDRTFESINADLKDAGLDRYSSETIIRLVNEVDNRE